MRPTWPPTPPPIRGTVPPLSKWDVYEDPTKVTKTISKADEPSKEDWQKIDELMKQWAKETFQFEPAAPTIIGSQKVEYSTGKKYKEWITADHW